MALPQKKDQELPEQYLDSVMKAVIFLSTAIAVQSLHLLEHILQLVQIFIQKVPRAHGLIGQSVDVEPLHFIYNSGYLGLVIFVWIYIRNIPIRNTMKLAYGLVTFVLIFQSWHFVEHTIKLEQYFIDGCVSCPGILGHFVSLPILHFAYNLIVLIPFVIALLLVTKDKKIYIKK